MKLAFVLALALGATSAESAFAQVVSPPAVQPHGSALAAGGAELAPVRVGDDQLTCDVLAQEMGSLSSRIQAAAGRMGDHAETMTAQMEAASDRQHTNAVSTVAGVVASFVPGAGLLLGAAQTLAAVSAPPAPAPDLDMSGALADAQAMQALIPIGERFEHLQAIWQSKGCG